MNGEQDMKHAGDKIRSLSVIAAEIRQDWRKPYFGAVPYLEAMRELDSIQNYYVADSGQSVVVYFLANAQTWRGETARRIKAELRAMCATLNGFYFLCGTRRVVRWGPQDYRVVCASCLRGGTVQYKIPEDAERAALRDSTKPCPCHPPCGAV